MADSRFSFRPLGFPTNLPRIPIMLGLVALGILMTISTVFPGAVGLKVTYLVQVSCLVGIAYVAVVLRQVVAIDSRERTLPKSLACDTQFFDLFKHFALSLSRAATIPDPVFRDAALQQLAAVELSLQKLGNGLLTFENTESWRLIYEQILRSNHVYSYKSVAWVKDELYWQDEPGQKSIRLNQELVSQQQIYMERIFILQDELWPPSSEDGDSKVIGMLKENARSRIKVFVIRESSLCNDQDLLADFGIYGSHAVGYQVMDGRQQTNRFTIQFNFDAVALAEQRWARLLAYAKPFDEILGRPP